MLDAPTGDQDHVIDVGDLIAEEETDDHIIGVREEVGHHQEDIHHHVVLISLKFQISLLDAVGKI